MKRFLLIGAFLVPNILLAATATVHHVPHSGGASIYERSITVGSQFAHPLMCSDVAFAIERYEHWLHVHADDNDSERKEKKEKHRKMFNWFEANCVRQIQLPDGL